MLCGNGLCRPICVTCVTYVKEREESHVISCLYWEKLYNGWEWGGRRGVICLWFWLAGVCI